MSKEVNINKFKAKDIHSMTVLHNLMRYQPYVLDIRKKKEYDSGHICNAIHIDMKLPPITFNDVKKLQKDFKNLKIEKHALILVYCHAGFRAGLVKTLLQNMGYVNVLSIGGVTDEPLKSLIEGKKTDEYVKICH